jgi:mycofactocin system glycosyltransferase
MSKAYRRPGPGCYRLTLGVRIVLREHSSDGPVAICAYPLRVVRINAMAARLLSLCSQERTCEQLARDMCMSEKRVEALCVQLCRKELLEAGPLPEPQSWPGVSIVIPSYNRARELERCLRSLLRLDYPARLLEIIVVDDGSADATSAMVQHMMTEAEQAGLTLRILYHDKQRGVAIARNTGAAAAQHDLIAYIDSDCVASSGWLTELVPVFQNVRTGAVGGMIRSYDRESMLGRYENVRSSLFMGLRPLQVRLEGPLTYLPTASLLVRRSLWQQLGGFAPLTFGEDVDFCRRLLIAGEEIQYLPQGTVYHDYRTKMGKFLRIRAAYASAEAALLRRHPAERRILVLPQEQATFASATIGSAVSAGSILWGYLESRLVRKAFTARSTGGRGYLSLILTMLALLVIFALTLMGARTRLRKVRQQRVPVGPLAVFRATLRGHLAYTYHLSRHLTRYYTLSLLALGLLLPPCFLLAFVLCSTVIVVDYIRLRPDMGLGEYALCSLLDDCAYEVGVVIGCIRYRTWKPLLPVIKMHV